MILRLQCKEELRNSITALVRKIVLTQIQDFKIIGVAVESNTDSDSYYAPLEFISGTTLTPFQLGLLISKCELNREFIDKLERGELANFKEDDVYSLSLSLEEFLSGYVKDEDSFGEYLNKGIQVRLYIKKQNDTSPDTNKGFISNRSAIPYGSIVVNSVSVMDTGDGDYLQLQVNAPDYLEDCITKEVLGVFSALAGVETTE